MRRSLPELALKKPITVLMITVSMLILGVIAWNRIPLNFLPKVDRPFIGVMIAYPGASPAQVEQQLAIPVEGELRTIPGLRRIRSTSSSNGCNVGLLFSLDTDIAVATAEVRDRLERLKLILPKEADKMLIERFSSGSIPVMAFGLFKGGDQDEFANLVRTVAEPRISRLDGVAKVEVLSPIQPKEVLIEFDQNTLRAMNLNLALLIQNLRESSINLSIGNLVDGERKFYARLVGEYRRLEDIANMVVTPNGLRLGQVAKVSYRSREEQQRVALDGKGGVVLLVIKESEANAVATCRNVHVELEKLLKEPAFNKVDHLVFFDQADLINRALKNLFLEGYYGALLSIAVLIFFLHKAMPTFIVSLAIPSCLLVAVVFMYLSGMTLNIVTMVSMIISVGMLVDDAIVVVENIIRHRQEGEPMRSAATNGAMEVGLAVVASTLTTVVVFVPMYFMDAGRMFVFMEQLAWPLIVSLLASLMVALTLVPLAMSRTKITHGHNIFQTLSERWRRKAEKKHVSNAPDAAGADAPKGGVVRRAVTWLGNLHPIQSFIDGYSVVLHLALRRRLVFLAGLAFIVWLTFEIPMQRTGMREMPKLDMREVRIDVALDQNFDLKSATALFQQVEQAIDLVREPLGIKKVLTMNSPIDGFFDVYLYTEDDDPKWSAPPYTTEQVMQILSEKIPTRTPGAEFRLSMGDIGDSNNRSDITLYVRGDERETLENYAERLKKILQDTNPYVSNVNADVEKSKQEMQIKIDQPLAQQAGVSPLILAQTVDAALRGARMPFMKQGRREIPVWAQFREEDRKSQANLDNVMVPGITGKLVPLQDLTGYSKVRSATAIKRVNGKNVITLSAKLNTKNLSLFKEEAKRSIALLDLPPGYNVDFGDELEDLESNIFNFTSSLAMAVILVYIVMAALFESLLLPMSIMTSVPLALGGAVWMVYFMDNQFDQITLIGCIIMVGVIVKNGIVVVDYINQLYSKTGNRTDAVLRAGRDRFRPVIMTALTTILGLVPLALAKTGGASTFSGLGQAWIGGLTVGTVLTLFVVPVFFTIFDDINLWAKNFFGNLLGRSVVPEEALTAVPDET